MKSLSPEEFEKKSKEFKEKQFLELSAQGKADSFDPKKDFLNVAIYLFVIYQIKIPIYA